MIPLKMREYVGRLKRQARKQRGWSQADLAAKLGSTQKWMSDVGRADPQLDLVLRRLRLLRLVLDARSQAESPSQSTWSAPCIADDRQAQNSLTEDI